MLPRFFAPDAGRSADQPLITLPADESTHLARVMRIARGDAIHVFNGTGGEWRAEVVRLARHAVLVQLLEPALPAAEPRIRLTLALALLKGDKMGEVIRDAVMLGAAAIQPLITARTESFAALARRERISRWYRIAIVSAKQCGRAVVPQIASPLGFGDWLRTGDPVGPRVMLVEPGASDATRHLRTVGAAPDATMIVGPEGGWTDDEVRLAESAGATLVTLGGMTIRADAMPVVALTAIRTLWQDL